MAKHSGEYYLRAAEKGGCTVKNGKGDHFKVYSPDHSSMMVVPYNLKGNGTEHSIIKWLLKFGITVGFLFVLYQGLMWAVTTLFG